MSERHFTSIREQDLEIAASARDVIDSSEDFFVLTGSYSIEALTKGEVTHNDIDANVFTKNIPQSMARAGLALVGEEVFNEARRIENTKPNRLEYTVPTNEGARDLEIQFVQYDDAMVDESGLRFKLPDNSGSPVIVPTVMETLAINDMWSEEFRVKSLSFAIATWALRISGVALSQKRAVRQSDVDHFAFLAKAPHSTDEVLEAMRFHPQMPQGESPQHVLDLALDKINKL